MILTSSQPNNRVGHLFPQVTDRTSPPSDTCSISVTLPMVISKDEEWECEVKANKALLELRRKGGSPVHINLITAYTYNETTALTAKALPPARVIKRYQINDTFPSLPKGKIAIFVGSHKIWNKDLTEAVESFCETNNAVVFVDHTSNYHGKYRIPIALSINQSPLNKANTPAFTSNVLIHIGEVTGEEGVMRMLGCDETWRVSVDGEIRDTFRKLSCVFEISEKDFFSYYSSNKNESTNTSFYDECKQIHEKYYNNSLLQLTDMPFSNVWIGAKIAPNIPQNSTVVLSILNTLRTWNYSYFNNSVNVYSPVGGFGIDGATSMMLGASLVNMNKKYFCITGDLAFFYDLNTLGNRHINNNIRILLINNGVGAEFKKTYSMAYHLLKDDVDEFVAAAGHFGNKSSNVIRHFAEDLGYEYLSASNKEEFNIVYTRFITSDVTDRPILLECFVNSDDDIKALNIIHNRN